MSAWGEAMRMTAAKKVEASLDQQLDAIAKFSARGNPTPLIISPSSAAAVEALARALAALTGASNQESRGA